MKVLLQSYQKMQEYQFSPKSRMLKLCVLLLNSKILFTFYVTAVSFTVWVNCCCFCQCSGAVVSGFERGWGGEQ